MISLNKNHFLLLVSIVLIFLSGCYTLSYVVGDAVGSLSRDEIQTVVIAPEIEFSDYNVYPADYKSIEIIDNRSTSSADNRTLTLPTLIKNDVEQRIMLEDGVDIFFANAFKNELSNNHITKLDSSGLSIECYILMFEVSKSPFSDEYTNSIRIRLNVMDEKKEVFSQVIQYHENGNNLEELVNSNLRKTFDDLWENESFVSSLLTIQPRSAVAQNEFPGKAILFKGMQNINLDQAEQALINGSVLASISRYFKDSVILDSESKDTAIEELQLRLTGMTESEELIELKNTDFVFVGSLLSTNNKDFLILKFIRTRDGSVVGSNLVEYDRNADIRATTDILLAGFVDK